jgi:hypothetical protein
MAIDRKRRLKPGPLAMTRERVRYIQLMNLRLNNAESCRMLGIGRKSDSKTGRVYICPAITSVGDQRNIISARTCPRTSGSLLLTGTAPGRACVLKPPGRTGTVHRDS